jgi:hypothetical protein
MTLDSSSAVAGSVPASLAFVRLTSAQVTSYVTRLGDITDPLTDSGLVIDLLQADGRRTFSRRDLTAILKGMGYQADEISDGKGYYDILDNLHARASKAEMRGWWILPVGAAAPIPTPAPKVVVAAAPSASCDPFTRLTSAEVSGYVQRLGEVSDPGADASRTIDLFVADGRRRAFSRRDLTAILLGAGLDKQTVSYNKGYYDILDVIHARASKAEMRGWWILPVVEEPVVEEPVVEEPVVEAAPEPEAPKVAAPPTPTLTMTWFEQQMREKNLDGRCARLLARHRPHEDEDDLLSHVNFWFAKWGASGQCDSYIEAGKAPSISILVHWLDHKWSHDEYHRAKDALYRESGKRTQSEIRHRRFLGQEDYVSPGAEKADPEAPSVVWKGSDEDGTLDRDYTNGEEEEPLAAILDAQALDLVRDLIRANKSRDLAADRYVRFAEHMFAGRSKEETAAIEGCSELRVTHLFQRVRDDLREAPVLLQVAMKVLDLVAEEPYSTQDEIAEEIPDAERALKLLALRGLVEEGSGQSFISTAAGRTALRVGSLI